MNAKAPRACRAAAPGRFGGDATTVSRYSCRHAAQPSLTDNSGKEDAKEEDEEPGEQHVGLTWSVKVAAGVLLLAGS